MKEQKLNEGDKIPSTDNQFNKKRKGFDSEKTENQSKKIKDVESDFTCNGCKSKNTKIAKFCSQCGIKLINSEEGSNLNEGTKQNRNEKKKTYKDQIYENVLTQQDFSIQTTKNFSLSKSVSHISNSLLALLGYTNDSRKMLADLIPICNKTLNNTKFVMNVVRNNTFKTPRLCYSQQMYLRHQKGYFMNVLMKIIVYFDISTHAPLTKLLVLDNILNMHVLEEIDSTYSFPPFNITLFLNLYDDIPPILKKIYLPYL
eukprot:TRINITY_DN3647_c0_g1_i1.p1 TRINITY_DN3647_c0_g1~~TRINITY_DN3647_c0_g1_i1.p1  ORF type:complete len:271 (-),score=50.05 TRINITY_DN3647_c0_g1_i1:3-776(-)